MKTLLFIPLIVLLAGCDSPLPMSDAEASAMKACMEKGLKPRFYANGSMREVSCKRK